MKKLVYIFLLIFSVLLLSACKPHYQEEQLITISFDSNGGNYIEDIITKIDTSIKLPIPEKEGYSFIGWFDLNDELYKLNSIFNSNTSLYAKYDITTLGLNFELIDDSYSVTSYEGLSTEVIIPSHYKGLVVNSISKGAFSDNEDLIKVVLPETILVIEEGAFENCYNLKSINFPLNLIKIGDSAFRNCENLVLEEIHAVNIGEQAFENCHSFVDIKISSSVKEIGGWAFFNCRVLNSVTFSVSPDFIGNKCFSWSRELKYIYVREQDYTTMLNLLEEAADIYTTYEVVKIGFN